jgi:hypothetical protein
LASAYFCLAAASYLRWINGVRVQRITVEQSATPQLRQDVALRTSGMAMNDEPTVTV